MRLSVRTEVQVEEARWRSSAEVVGRGMPMPDDLTGRERRDRSSGGIVVGVVPPKRERRNRVQRAASTGAKWGAIPSTTYWRCIHSCW